MILLKKPRNLKKNLCQTNYPTKTTLRWFQRVLTCFLVGNTLHLQATCKKRSWCRFLGFTSSACGTCWLLNVPINSIEGLNKSRTKVGDPVKIHLIQPTFPKKERDDTHYSSENWKHPLKIDGWKLNFPLQMVPFLETFDHFRRVITVTFGFEKKRSSTQKHSNKWDKYKQKSILETTRFLSIHRFEYFKDSDCKSRWGKVAAHPL